MYGCCCCWKSVLALGDATLDMLPKNIQVYLPMSSEPFRDCFALCNLFSWLCFVISTITRNYSQTDKLWSLTPMIYAWVYVFNASGVNPKLMLMTVMVSLWAIRLTLNFNRRGGYCWPPWGGEEDYRWKHVQEMLKAEKYPFAWILFNLTFVSFYQHFLLFSLVAPMHVAFYATQTAITEMDWAIAGFIALLILLEAIADEEQYVFQNKKYSMKNYKGPGFLSSGLWSLCRHPNYACEQLIWISFYGFAVVTRNMDWQHGSGIGALLLVSLFLSSARFSESISATKYKQYKDYQREKFMFFPFGRYRSFSLEKYD